MRQSNMELLRIISMLMVVTVHIDGSLGLPHPESMADVSARDACQLIIEALAIIGVNSFTMISGYFGIRLRVRSVVSYLGQCMFYAVLIYTLFSIAEPWRFTLKGWFESWLVLTHTDLWYVPAYFGLMLLSPFLNGGCRCLKKRTFGLLIAVLLIYNVWAGWWWGGKFNPTGYTLVQLVTVYLTGRYFGMHVNIDGCRRATVRLLSAGTYLISTAATLYLWMLVPEKALAYNSPFVLTATFGLFVFFMSLDFTSPAVNYIARSAFAVYLVHKAPQVFVSVFRPLVREWWASMELWQFAFASAGFVVGIYLMVMIVDAGRRYAFDAAGLGRRLPGGVVR